MNHLKIQTAQGVRTITLSRPEVRNAFNEALITEIRVAFEQAGSDPAVRCVVLAAEGKAFCAGADLNWMRRMADYTREQNIDDAGELARMLRTIFECPKPTIAQIQGDVYAGGLGLVAACDIAVASTQASFALTEVRLGLAPAVISPVVVSIAPGWSSSVSSVSTMSMDTMVPITCSTSLTGTGPMPSISQVSSPST